MRGKKRAVIVGGGYAGVRAALRARRALGTRGDVTLVSLGDAFVERVRLHEAAASGFPVERSLGEVLAEAHVTAVQARVMGIDVRRRRLALASGLDMAYDGLLLAVGSVVDVDRIPGARDHALALDGATIARTRAALDPLMAGAHVTVVGGGLTGIEAAAEIAERRPALRVRLVSGAPLGVGLSPEGARHLMATLARLDVETIEGERADEIEPGVVVVGGQRLPSALTLVAPGFVAPPLAREAGLAVGDGGRLLVDAALRVEGAPGTYAAGDAAIAKRAGGVVPMGCKSALPMGARAAENLAAELLDADVVPFDYRDTVYAMSLGRGDGVVQPMTADGRLAGQALVGPEGARLKERIVRSTMDCLEEERRRALGAPLVDRVGDAALVEGAGT